MFWSSTTSWLTGICSAALICFSVTSVQAAEMTSGTKPNILWLSFEDHGIDLPMYGDNRAHMPNMERISKEGCTFTRAFSTSPVCAPSRSTFITGVYAATLGTHNMRTDVPLPPDIKPFPNYLRKAGYYCTNNVKTDYNFPIPDGMWDETSRKAHWRNRPDPSQPFYSVFNFTVTHEGKFKMNDKQFSEITKDVKPEYRVKPTDVVLPPYFPDTPIVRKNYARGYDMVTQMDIEAGRVLKQLEEDGLATNTIVLMFADHGVGLPRNKRWLYDGGIQVPLVIKWPGHIDAGTRDEELVSLIDLPPTMMSFTGLKVPDYMQGRIILGDKKQPEPKYIYATRDRVDEVDETVRAVRDRQFKYIKNFMPEQPYSQHSAYPDGIPIMQEMRRMDEDKTLTGPATLFFAPHKPIEELYDTKKDPFEINNLADNPEFAEKLATMREALVKWQEKIHDKGMQPEPPAEKRRAARARGARHHNAGKNKGEKKGTAGKRAARQKAAQTE